MIKHIGSSLKQFVRKSPRKITVYASVALLACVLIIFFLANIFLDSFLKGRIIRALEETYPEYSISIAGLHYGVWQNNLECDSIVLKKNNSTFSCSVSKFSVREVGRIQLLWGGGVTPDNLVSSNADVKDIVLTFPRSQYELRCDRLRISVPDSSIVVDALELHPLTDDEQFFAGRKFRRTRYHLVIPRCDITGSACLGMLEGKIHCGRTAEIQNASLDVLINKDKPFGMDSITLMTPNDFLSWIMKTVQLNSVNITNGMLKYGERFAVGSTPALLTFDSMHVQADVHSNPVNHGDTLMIHAHGKLMQSGTMDVLLSIPVAWPEFTFRYSGSVRGMGLSSFNPFLEVSDHKRFKTGYLHSVLFDIDVVDGSAKGKVHAMYKDLKILSIDGETRSESGIGNTIVSFFTNNIKLRTTNMPDESGSMKVGEVKYRRENDDAFFEFAWLALRSGIGDVVGF